MPGVACATLRVERDNKVEHLIGHPSETPRTALDTAVREDLGADSAEPGGSAWSAAVSLFCCFAFGAIFPVAP